MPIPTRSTSLREPRKPTSTIGRTTTTKPTSTDNATVGPAKEANTLNRRKTLSAHRNTRLQDEPQSTARKQESRLPQRGTAQNEPSVNRRQSLIRPSPLKSVSTPKLSTPASTTKPSALPPALTSPRKARETTKESSQKKTDMLPPPRPSRSASVKQPVSATSTTSTPVKGHTRHRSQILTPVTSQSAKNADAPSSSNALRQKTQFSTYQQHFSPRKPVKPPISTPSPADLDSRPSMPSSWPEIAALQTELLQLNLLHSASIQRSLEWQTESEARLQEKYDLVAGTYKYILADEKERQQRLNAQALGVWLRNSRERSDRQDFPDQIQLLSQVAQEVSTLSSHDGRYTLAIREFEDWFGVVEEIKESRSRSDNGSMDHMCFIDPLDQAWKDELNGLFMKIELCARQLQSLDILGYGELENLEGSALLRVANGLRDMTNMMIREIKTIRDIEADVVRLERAWVGQITDQLIETRPAREDGERVGIWRRGKT